MSEKKTVLVVDDDPDFLAIAAGALDKQYTVIKAVSGAECRAMALKHKPDAIVLDVVMETLTDGLETAKALREDPKTKSIPIVMLTSVNQSYDYRSQMEESFFPHDRWLDKPVKPEALVKAVSELLKK